MIILDGKKYKQELLELYKKEAKGLDIGLAIIQIGNNPDSSRYIRNKMKACDNVGIDCKLYHYETITEDELASLIDSLNNDDRVTGIILQSPTPGIDFDKMAELILPEKDVDGFTSENIYRLYMNQNTIIPCTVKGIIKLLDYYKIPLEGKKITIIGRSNIVGKPLALALVNRNATVTLCHSKTKDLSFHTKEADILISAAGKPGLIKADMVKDGFVGVDVGTTTLKTESGEYKLFGDFDFDSVKDKASYITPVPGGVGQMTVTMIIDNLIEMKKNF